MDSILRVRDVMSSEVATLRRNDTLDVADDVMKLGRIRHLPVVDDDDALVGIVSQRDLFRGALAGVLGYGQRAQQRVLGTIAVKEIMHPDVRTIAPDVEIRDAAQAMLDHKIGCLPVVDGDALVGILTESDFVKLVVVGRRAV